MSARADTAPSSSAPVTAPEPVILGIAHVLAVGHDPAACFTCRLKPNPSTAIAIAFRELGIVCDPARFAAALPWGWAVVDTNAIGELFGGAIDELVGGLDGPDAAADPWDSIPARAIVP